MSTRSTVILLVVLAVAGLAIFWRPSSEPTDIAGEDATIGTDESDTASDTVDDATMPPKKTTTTKTPVPSAEDSGPSTYLTINYDQDTTYAPKAFVVEQGAHVVMRITSSRTDTAAIAGLGLSVPVTADVQSTLEFDAETLGLFEIRLQEFGFGLGTIEVIAAE